MRHGRSLFGRLARWLWLPLALGGLFAWSAAARSDALVVYCAHDAVHADALLRAFAAQTGIRVHARYDTEATKSLGLVELLSRERRRPRADVFWNNELLGTLRLADEGALEAYCGPGFARMPERYKDAGGLWVGFAARLRVWLVHDGALVHDDAPVHDGARAHDARAERSARPLPEQMPEQMAEQMAEQMIATRLAAQDLSRVALADPLYGTTRTHYTLLWHLHGGAAVAQWHAAWRRAGVREVPGNAVVKDLVAAGACDVGLTDSDDAFLARDQGAGVRIAPVRVQGRTICIPNTVAIVRGTARRADAERLVDFLLSARAELALARAAARQIPLGPVAQAELPADVRDLAAWAADAHDLRALRTANAACLEWLRAERLR